MGWRQSGDTASRALQISRGNSAAPTRRLTLGQFPGDLRGRNCVNVGIVYVHPLSLKSNSPEGPLRYMPMRHTVYFLYRDPYYAVAERWAGVSCPNYDRSGTTSPRSLESAGTPLEAHQWRFNGLPQSVGSCRPHERRGVCPRGGST